MSSLQNRVLYSSGDIGKDMYEFMSKLFPICRSITGNGVRETLNQIQGHIPLEVHEVPSGTQVFDWTVPKEWNIADAYIKNSEGQKVVDFKQSNLHVVSYSTPIKKSVTRKELSDHVFTLPEHPDWIPYRTAYYKETWGFCLTHNQFLQLRDEEYEVVIESSLENGALTYGQYYIPGRTEEEILISCHVCHPSLCNDNLSGIALTTFLAKSLAGVVNRYSYRFLFIPVTIGSIAWLCFNRATLPKIRHGLVVVCVGDPGKLTYKKSRRGDAEIDRAARHVLQHCGKAYDVIDFYPFGYDERQYCSPAFNLPVGSLSRSPHGRFPEYHTSADDMNLVQPQHLADSFEQYLSILSVLENNHVCLNRNPECEPQLGKRGLYRAVAGQADTRSRELAMLWVLNLSDGQHSLLDIAERAGIEFETIKLAADALSEHDLLERVEASGKN
jgi:aminopeptidase-like protein